MHELQPPSDPLPCTWKSYPTKALSKTTRFRIKQLLSHAFGHAVLNYVFDKNPSWLLGLVNKELVACVAYRKINITMVYMSDFSVRQDYRGRGVGRAMLEQVKQLAAPLKVVWEVVAHAKHIVEFYKKCGYSPLAAPTWDPSLTDDNTVDTTYLCYTTDT